ncbi:SDR family NAD(P)-dependent oxidoreductase [Cytophaga hutchinsonii]|uniref:Short chain dehydrogenase possible 3-oxoacyl-[acyl-carrier-protein] reductase n=1 Tax=Cytophaga hutchinsonii (strain ATCC 33406 / DSM 1761 / CIP 103989 / NBRC 15051 / NCIMB 9469 / D465) TaxID=269798 RepID=A0A6N4SPR2_CYTH3|nr:SDR family oxidoreductase [Cytophaga hutchinsonii]ABG58334.1 short chain dehydrogenase; possible 3-oxoacyl-[acyl-carrier-protein] reductase [Cytophaga hutchinsonii ATCC 33406]SFX52348.1 NAD(P)-dependent dehydrogenase, short-chain alcohol dehydrogenase family [Cytophaga hutchinsonii ATCC 33406]
MIRRTFLFAGASSAIARQTAMLLKEKGHSVIGLSRKEPDDTYDEYYQVSGYDFSTFPEIGKPIDGLVYFPGTIHLKPVTRFTPAEFTSDLQINTLGAAAFVQAYLSDLKKSPNASIVFLSSVAASVGLPFHTSIAMAKGALEGFAKALAAELAPAIRVNVVAPSLLDTPLGNTFIHTPDKLENMQKRNPLRQIGKPTDVANAIAFLLSEESAWVTGQVFAIDGGMSTIKN